MELNNDLEWLRKKAEAEDGCCVSVGGSSYPLIDASENLDEDNPANAETGQ